MSKQISTRGILGWFLVVALLAASPAQAGGKSIVGHWEIQGTPAGAPGPAFSNQAHITLDGLVTNIDPWFGTGLGQWQRVQGRNYLIEFTHYFLDSGTVGEVRVLGEVKLSADHQGFSGTFETQITVGGFLVDTVVGTVEGSRQ